MKIKTYSNNLRLVVNTKKDVDVVSFMIFVKVGAKDEADDEFGFAHFLEHMFFKSTNKTHFTDILKKLDELGVSHNAYTSMGTTSYYFKCLSNVLEDAVSLFSEMFFNYSYKKDEITKEKKVILEELKMDEDDQDKKSITQAFSEIFKGTAYGHKIIGTKGSINSVTAEKLKDFKRKNYTPNKIVISISGNISNKKASRLVKKYFINNFDNEKTREISYDSVVKIDNQNKYITKNKDIQQSVVYILGDLGEQNYHQRAVLNLYFAILGFGMSSKLFEIIRGKMGMVYSIDAGCTNMGENIMYEIMFATSTENVAKALHETKKILKACAEGDISNEELERAKNKFIASIAFSNESNSSIARGNGTDLLQKGKIRTDKEIENEYKSVNLSDIKDVAKKIFSNEKYVVSAVGKCKKSDLKNF